MARGTEVQRDDRREARKAVAEAKRAGKEAGKLAKTLSRDARASLEALTASAQDDVRAARRELDENPRRAKRTAKRAAARLELASRPGHDLGRRPAEGARGFRREAAGQDDQAAARAGEAGAEDGGVRRAPRHRGVDHHAHRPRAGRGRPEARPAAGRPRRPIRAVLTAGCAMTRSDVLDRGRAAFDEHRWTCGVRGVHRGRPDDALEAADLERLSTVALLLGREDEGIDLATRAHEAFLGIEDRAGAARCATWIGLYLGGKGDEARSNGWLARARRIAGADASASASAEGLLLAAAALEALYSGEAARAERTFAEAFAAAEQVRDRDAMTLAQLGQGQALLMLGDPARGLALLDEAMVAVTAGEVSPVASGVVYCSVIGTCHLAFDVRRAHEWTIALERWCGERPDMVMFTGQCQAHRAALYCLHGAWSDAMAASRVAQERVRIGDWSGAFGAWYQEAEVHRLLGEFEAAERSYHRAAEGGYPPQPGLALLRLAQGRVRDARALVGAAVEQADPATRRQLLVAVVEIELAAGDAAAAREAADELTTAALVDAMPMVRALAARCDAAVRIEEGDAEGALDELRAAWRILQELDMPYEAARCRVLTARAWRALADEDSASMDLEAARAVFVELGAVPDVLAVDALSRRAPGAHPTPLTPREIEVVRLVAEGKTNRTIAGELYVSEKTVDRHLSNVFTKLGISSRAAATAYAYEHALI